MTEYRVLRTPRREMRRVRGIEHHLTRWGPDECESAAPVFLLHGWQDTGDTFQFMVDAFERERPLVALDWRGFGRSAWAREGYWFADYFADLEALLDELSPAVPVTLIGHSMGGNIASLYAGLRPERVSSVVNLEGFGLPRTQPADAPERIRKWLKQVKAAPLSKDYESFEQLAAIIAFRYPRFAADQAAYLARAWGRWESGRVHLWGDPRHRWINPTLYQREEAEMIWREVSAPMLMLLGAQSDYLTRLGADGTNEAFRAIFSDIDIVHVEGAGHMLHIEKANVVAALVEEFLSVH